MKKFYERSKRSVVGVLLLCVWLWAGITPGLAQDGGASGQMALPARGLFSLQEGTIEAWVQLNFDPAAPVEGYTARGELFRFQVPKADNDLGAEMGVFFASTRSGQAGDEDRSFSFLRAGFAIDGKEVPHPLVVECENWKRGEWHHVAVTWQDARRMKIYFDGQLVVVRGEAAETEYPYSIARDIPDSARLIIGSQFDGAVNDLTIDEFRLSSAARSPETLGFDKAPLAPDPFTMLLENFESVAPPGQNGTLETAPAVIAMVSAPQRIAITDGVLVPGKFGKAWMIRREK
jgi:hypothetical protein